MLIIYDLGRGNMSVFYKAHLALFAWPLCNTATNVMAPPNLMVKTFMVPLPPSSLPKTPPLKNTMRTLNDNLGISKTQRYYSSGSLWLHITRSVLSMTLFLTVDFMFKAVTTCNTFQTLMNPYLCILIFYLLYWRTLLFHRPPSPPSYPQKP